MIAGIASFYGPNDKPSIDTTRPESQPPMARSENTRSGTVENKVSVFISRSRC